MVNQHRATKKIARLTLGRELASLTAFVLLFAVGARAQETSVASLAAVNQGTQVAQSGAPVAPQEAPGSHTLHLLVGRSLVISSPTPIKRVSVADPNIVEAVVISPYQVLLNGKVPGGVSFFLVWDETDQVQTFEVSVDIDILSLAEKIHEVFPLEDVHLETSKDVVMLSGHISSPAVADKILEIVKNSSPKVTSLMQYSPIAIKEVLLEVKFAELDRSAVSQLGVNILHQFGSALPVSVSTQQFSPPSFQNSEPSVTSGNGTTTGATPAQFNINNLLNISVFSPSSNMAAMIEALQNDNVLQILAEPNLLTESGKQASFLAGGEFPYPVVQGLGSAGGVGAITIQFREYGVRLNFTPTLTQDGLIHLNVKPEVSSLDYANEVTISGFVIPALSTRRAESDMELRDGQSFAIAGLIDNQVTEQMSKIPGISSVPILGKLFQSRALNKSKDELIIIVTPRIVQPLTPDTVPPGPVFPKTFLGPATLDKDAAPKSK